MSRRSVVVLATALIGAACGDSGAPAARVIVAAANGRAVVSADSLTVRAESLYWASEFDSATVLWNASLGGIRARADYGAEARTLGWLGLTSRRKGDLAAARAHLEDAIRVGSEHGAETALLEAHNGLGLVAQDEDGLAEARQHFQDALRIAERSGDRRGIAKASGNLGLTYAYLGELGRARDLITMLRDSGAALGDARYQANGMANLAMLDIWEGRPRAAIAVLDSARILYRADHFIPGEQNALGQLATAYEEIGEYGRALATLDSSLSLAREKGMKEDEVEILRLIAGLHARVGDYRVALRYYDQTASAASALDLGGELGSVKRSAAAIHLELGDVAQARGDAREALRIHRSTDEPFDELDDLLVLAEVEDRAGSAAESNQLLADAATVARTLGARSARAAVALTSARLADRARNPARVIAALRGIDSLLVPGDFAGAGEAHALVARAWSRRGSLDSAVASGARAIAAIERVRGGLASEPLRRTLLANRSGVYADQVLALLRLGRTSDAFAVADAARSRGLLDYLAAAKDDRHGAPGRTRLEEGERLLHEIEALVARLKSLDSVPVRERGAGAGPTSVELMSRVERARADYEALLVRAGREQPRVAALLGARATTVGDVQRVLDADEALLEFLVGPDRIVLFVATRASLRTVEIPDALVGLTDRVRLLRELWGSRDVDWQRGLPAARALYRTLLGDAIQDGMLEGKRRLIIVPHGVLAQLPFAALVDGQTGRFVIQDFDVMYVPAAGTLPALRPHVVAGRPASLGGAAFAPFPRDLPASLSEVEAVRRAMSHVAGYVGGSATEPAVRAALADEGIVHVASHGVLNSRNPMFSRIEVVPSSAPDGADGDGRLEVHELVASPIRSPLVFLSGCETSAAETWLDDAVRGSDHTTLAQALLYAGAANVVGTLWRIDDSGAAAFAESFYRSLARESAAGSLASAQRALLRSSRYAHPYYWAAYVLTGEGKFGP